MWFKLVNHTHEDGTNRRGEEYARAALNNPCPLRQKPPSGYRLKYRGDQGRVSPACDGGVFHGAHLLCDRLNHPVLQSRYFLVGYRLFGPSVA